MATCGVTGKLYVNVVFIVCLFYLHYFFMDGFYVVSLNITGVREYEESKAI